MVKKAAGSGMRVEIVNGAGMMFASDADPRSMNLGTTGSAGCDFNTLYDCVRRSESSNVGATGLEAYNDRGRRADVSCG